MSAGMAGVAGIAMNLVVDVGPAAAHGNEPHGNDEKHAAEDQAGVPIEQIERDARANAAKVKKATGEAPGARTADQQVANDRMSVQAADDPGQGGRWSSVINTPVVPVFQAVLPNGKVLMWDSVSERAAENETNHTYTRAAVWNPSTNTYKQVNVSGYNIFCAGFAQLADGRVLVAGGNKSEALDGIVQTHLFDWRTETWTRGPNMNVGRWYPSVAALGNGEALIVAGGPATAEVYQTNGALRRLTGFTSFDDRIYPFLVPRPDGQVQLVGPDDRMDTMATSGTGALTATRNRDGIKRDYGSFATYDIGKVLVAGGGNVTEGGQSSVPTKTASVVDVNGSGTTVRSTTPMSVGRRQFNLSVLADGSVLATGGQSKSLDHLVDLENPVFAAERWDPATETWSVLASASRVRQYHAVATLLPDGRVMTGGGGICGTCTSKGYLEKNIEYFTPPYLFRKDGSGTLAARPVIGNAPATASYGQQFAISTAQAGSIRKVGLVRLGAPTHGADQGQRYVPLKFSASGSTLTTTAPSTATIAQPGYYMLFVTDAAGVPSVAKIVQVRAQVPVAPVRTTAPSSDYDGDRKTDIAIWRPSTGGWSVRGGSTATIGGGSDVPVPADYNGDGKADIAVWRPSTGTWSLQGAGTTTYGVAGDKPVPADYDGDGKAEIAVWRPSIGRWYVQGKPSITYGVSGDIPVPADYNGDGKADLAVWRPATGQWFVRGISTTTWGIKGDKPVQADFTGDGKAEVAVWRPSTGRWYVRGQATVTWGVSGDVPVLGDYDGNGKTDLTVWRPSTGQWWVRGSSAVVFGQRGDIPV